MLLSWSEIREHSQDSCPGDLEIVLASSLEALQTHLDTALSTLDWALSTRSLRYSVISWLCWLTNQVTLVYGVPPEVKHLLFCNLHEITDRCAILKPSWRPCYDKYLHLIVLWEKSLLYAYWAIRNYQPVKKGRQEKAFISQNSLYCLLLWFF